MISTIESPLHSRMTRHQFFSFDGVYARVGLRVIYVARFTQFLITHPHHNRSALIVKSSFDVIFLDQIHFIQGCILLEFDALGLAQSINKMDRFTDQWTATFKVVKEKKMATSTYLFTKRAKTTKRCCIIRT